MCIGVSRSFNESRRLMAANLMVHGQVTGRIHKTLITIVTRYLVQTMVVGVLWMLPALGTLSPRHLVTSSLEAAVNNNSH